MAGGESQNCKMAKGLRANCPGLIVLSGWVPRLVLGQFGAPLRRERGLGLERSSGWRKVAGRSAQKMDFSFQGATVTRQVQASPSWRTRKGPRAIINCSKSTRRPSSEKDKCMSGGGNPALGGAAISPDSSLEEFAQICCHDDCGFACFRRNYKSELGGGKRNRGRGAHTLRDQKKNRKGKWSDLSRISLPIGN